jgi:hypothetical protein
MGPTALSSTGRPAGLLACCAASWAVAARPEWATGTDSSCMLRTRRLALGRRRQYEPNCTIFYGMWLVPGASVMCGGCSLVPIPRRSRRLKQTRLLQRTSQSSSAPRHAHDPLRPPRPLTYPAGDHHPQ